ncbi:amino acid adenylation domain-containing protein [Streptomyces sp. NPDC097640]|uniref:non-ribosomal peptide synthetase n=1 Tax=Streptomyces sp. NPDC097640 TaxID=3157229 RepID=UPI00331F76AE
MTGPWAPLSQQQRAVWAAQQLNQGSDLYNVPVAFRLNGPISRAALEESVRQVMERHPLLRVSMEESGDGVPRQQVCGLPAEVLSVHDVPTEELDERIAEAASTPFGPDAERRLRAHLFRTAPCEAVLLLVFDHVAVDAASIPLITQDLARGYSAGPQGAGRLGRPTSMAEYFDYIAEQRERFASPAGHQQAEFWGKYLEGMNGIAAPLRNPGLSQGDLLRTSSVPVELPGDLVAAGERLRVTPFSLLLSALSVTLQHFLRSEDVAIAYPAMDWRRGEYSQTVGLFTDMLLFRCLPQEELSLQGYVRSVQDSLFECFDHQEAPLGQLWACMRTLQARGGHSGIPVMLSLNDAPESELRLPDIEVERIPLAPRDGKADLLLSVNMIGSEISGRLDFKTQLYDTDTARRIARAFHEVLTRILAGWDGPVRAVELAPEEDRSQVLDTWNARVTSEPDQLVPAMFARQVKRSPQAIALIEQGREITYRELDETSRNLAARIARLGLRPGRPVALCLPRSARFVAAALAVMRCGLAFLPVDLEQPARRRAFVVSEAGAAAAVVQGATADHGLPATLSLVDAATHTDAEPVGPGLAFDDVPVSGGDPAYLITTSGSTGLPKAVAVPHRALANNLNWKRRDFGFHGQDRFYFKTPPVFDASLWEYLAPLTVGALAVVAPPSAHRDPAHMLREMRQHEVSVVQFVPTLLKAVLAEEGLGECAALRRVFSGGEQLEQWVVDAVHRACGARTVNLYGPTEAGIEATFHEASPATDMATGTVPIGRPIPGAQAYVLGPGGQVLPPGFVGELHLGGLPLALGYANRDQLTRERFIPHPFTDDTGARLYRTGDLARFREDGVLEFLGREDAQVKVRGLRVELDGVRSLVLQHPGVNDAVVTISTERDDSLLVHFVSSGDIGPDELRAHLADRLPAELMPTHLLRLAELPVTATGKVDTRALPRPQEGQDVAAHATPRTALEQRLAGLWAEVLGVGGERVPRDASLFELGGTSLTLIRLHRLLRQRISADIPITDLFKYPTVAAVARSLSRRSEDDKGRV